MGLKCTTSQLLPNCLLICECLNKTTLYFSFIKNELSIYVMNFYNYLLICQYLKK